MKRRDFLATSMIAGIGAAGVLVKTGDTGAADVIAQGGEAALGEAFAILAQPLLQWVDVDRAILVALTSHAAACHLEIREAGSNAEPRIVNTHHDGLIDANETFHRIEIDELLPGREYEYVLIAKHIVQFEPYKIVWGDTVRSAAFHFTTPKADSDAVRFTVLNDLHKNVGLIRQLFTMVEARPELPEFVMLNGDILSHINDESDILSIFDLPGSYASEHPTVWVRGNHECRGQFARYMNRYLARPDERYYYTMRRGPVQMLVLDCGEDKEDSHWAYSGLNNFDAFRKEEERWFRSVLESDAWKNAPWRVLVVHIPLEKGTINTSVTPDSYRYRWAELMEQAGLDLEIAAHYHRVAFTDRSEKQGFPILIGGGPDASAVAYHVSATPSTLEVEMTDAEGKSLKKQAWRH